MTTPRLTLRELNRATLARQMLLRRESIPPLAAIERLVALQAQWPRPPFVGLWTRLPGFERRQLAALFEAKKVVRATFLRGTLHVVSARDYLALRPALQGMLDASLATILKQRGVRLDVPALVEEARDILAEGPLTFEDLRERLLHLHPKADERAMGYAVRMSLPLVMTPEAKDEPWTFPARSRFSRADAWLARPVSTKPGPPDDLLLRYLAAYGPATVADLQAWSGLPKLKEAVEALRPRVVELHDERGRTLFDLPKAPRPEGGVEAPVRFVPEYDNLVATRADERFVARVHRPKVYLSALRIAATVLVDGFVAATWRVDRAKRRSVLTVTPFAPLPARVRKEVAAEAEALLAFCEEGSTGLEVKITTG